MTAGRVREPISLWDWFWVPNGTQTAFEILYFLATHWTTIMVESKKRVFKKAKE